MEVTGIAEEVEEVEEGTGMIVTARKSRGEEEGMGMTLIRAVTREGMEGIRGRVTRGMGTAESEVTREEEVRSSDAV